VHLPESGLELVELNQNNLRPARFTSRREAHGRESRLFFPGMGFPVRTKGPGKREHMFSQWGLVGTGNTRVQECISQKL